LNSKSWIRIQIEEEERRLLSLQTETDKVNYLTCVAKVLKEDKNPLKPVETNVEIETSSKHEEM
jgi:hypothetical protein